MGYVRRGRSDQRTVSTYLVEEYEILPENFVNHISQVLESYYYHHISKTDIPTMDDMLRGMPVFLVEMKRTYLRNEGIELGFEATADIISQEELEMFIRDIEKIIRNSGFMIYSNEGIIINKVFQEVW